MQEQSIPAPSPYVWGYRNGLVGLRAIAVYLVIGFHSGSGLLNHGYVGVDLFFVLSGFLISQLLLSEIDSTGSISYLRFIARRMRRLGPAIFLFFVIVPFLMVGVLAKSVRAPLIGDGQAALLYVSNWRSIINSGDYFAADQVSNPFIRFWSLAIEEQFYFVFPAILILICTVKNKFRTIRHAQTKLFALIFIGAVLVQIFVADDPAISYYGTHTRVYQLFAGALLASIVRGSRYMVDKKIRSLIFTASILLLGFLALNLSNALSLTYHGVFVTVASVGLIFSLDDNSGLQTNLLGGRIVVYLGSISYATYLWHWPLIVIMREVVDATPVQVFLLTSLLATAIASLSHALVEMPVRNSKKLDQHPRSVIFVGLGVSLLLSFVVVPSVLGADGVVITKVREIPVAAIGSAVPMDSTESPDGYNPIIGVADGFDFSTLKVKPAAVDDLTTCLKREIMQCRIVAGSDFRVFIIGDSHAKRLITVMRRFAEARKFSLYATTNGSCLWQIDLEHDRSFPDSRKELCQEIKDDLYERVLPAVLPDVVVLVHRTFDSISRLKNFGKVEFVSNGRTGDPATETTLETISWFRSRGVKVILVEPVPDSAKFNSRDCLAGAKSIADALDCTFHASTEPTPIESLFRSIDKKYGDVLDLDMDLLICPRLPICDPLVNSRFVWVDHHHLTNEYLDEIYPSLEKLLMASGMFPGKATEG